MGSGLEQEDGFLLFHVEKLESVSYIENLLGTGFKPQPIINDATVTVGLIRSILWP